MEHSVEEAHIKGLTTPRVTPSEVEAAIVSESYTVLPNGRTTICQLTLDNGFTVEGSSACVSIENFDAVKGNSCARERAIDKVWAHLGFRLADRLAAATKAIQIEVMDTSTVKEAVPYKPIELGDQVHFFERVGDKVSEPMLAFVTTVLGPCVVGLTVMAPNGTTHARDTVTLVYPWLPAPNLTFFARPKP